MNLIWFFIIAIVIFLLIVIPLGLFQANQLAKTYGPEQQISGNPCAWGSLICESWKAPTIGGTLQFPYEVTLYAQGDALTGEYRYAQRKAVYSGQIFLTYRQGSVKGRLDGSVVEGKLSPDEADLTLGYPQGSLISFLNGPFAFRIAGEDVYFLNTDNSQDSIGATSKLTVEADRISGQLEHGRQSWVASVDVTYQGVPRELVTLALLLMSSAILSFHHD
jgi:hypothetical protein